MKCRMPIRIETRREIQAEVKRAVVAESRGFQKDYDSAILWVLHSAFGFGAERPRRFWDAFHTEYRALEERYLIENTQEGGDICRRGLKNIGVDVDAWYKEEKKSQ